MKSLSVEFDRTVEGALSVLEDSRCLLPGRRRSDLIHILSNAYLPNVEYNGRDIRAITPRAAAYGRVALLPVRRFRPGTVDVTDIAYRLDPAVTPDAAQKRAEKYRSGGTSLLTFREREFGNTASGGRISFEDTWYPGSVSMAIRATPKGRRSSTTIHEATHALKITQGNSDRPNLPPGDQRQLDDINELEACITELIVTPLTGISDFSALAQVDYYASRAPQVLPEGIDVSQFISYGYPVVPLTVVRA